MTLTCSPIAASLTTWLTIAEYPMGYFYADHSADSDSTNAPRASHEFVCSAANDYPSDRSVAAADVTSVHLQPITVVDVVGGHSTARYAKSDVDYRFSSRDHQSARQAILSVLRVPYRHKKRFARFTNCGGNATVWHSTSTDRVKILARHCGLRVCPRCREMHAARTRDVLARFLKTVEPNRLSMVTLTLSHSERPLSEQLDHLYASFRRLRASKIWKTCKAKGYAVLEISRSTDGLQWHPHLHLLADMPYCPHDLLRSTWWRATGDSSIVDIRRVNSHAVVKHQKYLTNYLSKPPTEAIQSDAIALGEWVDALCSRRVLIKFGSPKLAAKLQDEAKPDDWKLIGTLIGLIRAMDRGNAQATHWLARIGRGPALEQRDPDAGKDYSLDLAYRTDSEQFY